MSDQVHLPGLLAEKMGARDRNISVCDDIGFGRKIDYYSAEKGTRTENARSLPISIGREIIITRGPPVEAAGGKQFEGTRK